MTDGLIVGVAGIGAVGWRIAQEIAVLKPTVPYRISQLVLFSRDERKLEVNTNILKGLEPEMKIAGGLIGRIGDFHPDVLIQCASNPEVKTRGITDRREMGLYNLKIQESVCSQALPDAAIITETNGLETLCQFNVNSLGKNPKRVIGCAEIDAIRARIAIKNILMKYVPPGGKLDLSGVCTMGTHNDGEIILPDTITVNGLYLKEWLVNHEISIEDFASQFAHEQVAVNRDTSELAARAMILTLNALLTQSGSVSAATYCNFEDDFFRVDIPKGEDPKKYYELVNLAPKIPVYLVMPVRFKELDAEFADPEFFRAQSFETKKRFLQIAKKQEDYIEKLILTEKIKPPQRRVEIPPAAPAKIERGAEQNYAMFVAVNHILQRGGIIYDINSANPEKRSVFMQTKKPVKRIGFLDDGDFYAAMTNAVQLEGSEIVYPYYRGNESINSLVVHEEKLFAAHSDRELGILVSSNDTFSLRWKGNAKSLVIFNGLPLFASGTTVIDASKCEWFRQIETEEEIVALVPTENHLYIADQGNLYSITDTSFALKKLQIPGIGNIVSAAEYQGKIALLTGQKVVVVNPLEGRIEMEFSGLEGYRKLASKGTRLVCYDPYRIAACEGNSSRIIWQPPHDMEIASVILF